MNKKLKNIQVFLISIFMIGGSSLIYANFDDLAKRYPTYLKFTVPNQFEEIEPGNSSIIQTHFLLPLVFESLVKVNDKQQISPVLAKSWKVNLNNNTLTMTLHNDHYFSDGSNVTAYDVEYSLNRLCDILGNTSKELKSLVGCTIKERKKVR